jgi:septal ring factor EnvC (AmiA/AmiB activator)
MMQYDTKDLPAVILMKQELREREAEIDALRSYLSKSEDTVEGLEAEIATAEINFARYQDTIKELRTENERLRGSITDMDLVADQSARITQLEAVLEAAQRYHDGDLLDPNNYAMFAEALATISPTEETP